MPHKYKKTYEGDYTKSYKDYVTWKKLGEQQKREYESVSKKLNENPYSKKERTTSFDAGRRPEKSERVDAEGSATTIRTTRTNWNKENVYTPNEKKEIIDKTPETYEHPIVEETKQWKNAYEEAELEDDGNYNFFDTPIEEIGVGRYRNLKTGKELDIDQTREVLNMAGYVPKSALNIGAAIFAFIFANIIFPNYAPLVALGYGVMKMMTSKTTWSKNAGGQVFKYVLPASDLEVTVNKRIGQICIVVGIIAGFIRYQHLLFQ